MKILSFGRFRMVFIVLSLTTVVASAQVGELLTAGKVGVDAWKLGGWSGVLAFAVAVNRSAQAAFFAEPCLTVSANGALIGTDHVQSDAV